ncbi:MAG: methyltransferase family protein [Promethearchaeota archaeon]
MKMPGFDGLKVHLPDYNEKQVKLLVARLPGIMMLVFIFSFFLDFSCRLIYQLIELPWLISIEPIVPIINSILFVFGGSQIAQIGFRRKQKLMKKDRERAYQKVAKPVFNGIGMAFGGLLYALLPHSSLPFGITTNNPPINDLTAKFSESLLITWLGFSWEIYFRFIIGIIILAIALGTAMRALKEFGVDNATLVYVYYPESSKIVNNDIYSIVRHPMYMGVILISLSGVFLHFSIYSYIHFLITVIAFAYHIFIMEEKELIERFGDSYQEYQKEVPALIIRPKNWGKLVKFIFG